jgi:hypothetical protein
LPENGALRIDDLRLPEIVRAGIERGADSDAEACDLLVCAFVRFFLPGFSQPMRSFATSSIFEGNSRNRRCSR